MIDEGTGEHEVSQIDHIIRVLDRGEKGARRIVLKPMSSSTIHVASEVYRVTVALKVHFEPDVTVVANVEFVRVRFVVVDAAGEFIWVLKYFFCRI